MFQVNKWMSEGNKNLFYKAMIIYDNSGGHKPKSIYIENI